MNIIQAGSDVGVVGVDLSLEYLAKNSKANVAGATGNSMTQFFGRFSQHPDVVNRIRFFGMDEYVVGEGEDARLIDRSDPVSFRGEIYTKLANIAPPAEIIFPDVDNIVRPGSYDRVIREHGGIDLGVIGIGYDHIAFFGDGTPFDWESHHVELSPEFRTNNNGKYGVDTPGVGVTMGPRTILDIGKLLVLIYTADGDGDQKIERLRRSWTEPPHPGNIISLLHLHKDVTLILDEKASEALNGDFINER